MATQTKVTRGLTIVLVALCFGCQYKVTISPPNPDCGDAVGIRPDSREYKQNAKQFDAVCLPQAWYHMRDKWIDLDDCAPNTPCPRFPWVVVIDDGFFQYDDAGAHRHIHLNPGYPDGSGVHPGGSAWGDIPPQGTNQVPAYGFHGTAVLSLLGARTNNGLISGVSGSWTGTDRTDVTLRGDKWGPTLIPVRIGRGLQVPPTRSILVQIFDEVVFESHEIRTVNLSKTLIDFPRDPNVVQRLQQATSREVIVITGGGNKREVRPDNHWLKEFENVIIVGALNEDGTDLWIDGPTEGTATGLGIDIYAPGENLNVIPEGRTITPNSGTSFAVPFVTGVVSMMQNIYDKDGNLLSRPWVIRDILIKTADIITPTNHPSAVRRLNAYKAVLCASNSSQTISWEPGGNRIEQWNCDMGTLGSASGVRRTP